MRKLYFRAALNFVLLIFMVIVLIFHDLIIYGIEQGAGQIDMIRKAVPITEVLNDPKTTDSVRYKLELIGDIRTFAFDSLGMTKSDNYTSYYDQKGKPRLLTISAAEPFDLEAYHWTFPVLGSVSYKGYFNRKRADREILDLRMKGYDVDLYYPSGWSTLGWFKDPVLSGMLKREEHDLADLIIHELTHGTLYVKSSVTFNENLANFIGDKGAEKFLLSRFGPRSKEYRQYKRSKSDEKVYSTYMLAASYRLDSLYMHLNASHLSVEEKKAAKTKLLTDISIKVMKLPLFQKKKYFKYSLQSFREGNAFFMSFRRYDSQYDIFDNEFRRNYNSDLRPYLEALKQRYPDV